MRDTNSESDTPYYYLGGRMEKHSLAIGSKAFHTVMASFNIKMARNMLDDSSKAQWCVFLRFCPATSLCTKFKNWRRDHKKFNILLNVASYYFLFLKIMCSQKNTPYYIISFYHFLWTGQNLTKINHCVRTKIRIWLYLLSEQFDLCGSIQSKFP